MNTTQPTGARINARHVHTGMRATLLLTDGTTLTGTIRGFGRSAVRMRDDAGEWHDLSRIHVRSIHEAPTTIA